MAALPNDPIPFDRPSDEPPTKGTYPGVEWGYDFVRPSYEIVERRHEAVAARARSFLTLGAALVVAAPALAKVFSDQLILSPAWLLCGLFLFLVSAALNVWVQGSGSLLTINPNLIYDHLLHMDEWEFKLNVLDAAGTAFAKNTDRVNFEAAVVDIAGVFTVGEVLVLACWMLGAPTP